MTAAEEGPGVRGNERTVTIQCVAGTVQHLGRLVWRLNAVEYDNGLATAGSTIKITLLTPVSTTAPTSTANIGFTGTPESPSSAVYLKTAAVAGVALRVHYLAPGGHPA
jgi:hypothetical protein